MDIKHYIYQSDSSKRVPNESKVLSWSLKGKCKMIHERLMVNGLDEKFWYEPPASWLQYFGILLENYIELIPKPRARRNRQASESEVLVDSNEEQKEPEVSTEEERNEHQIQSSFTDPASAFVPILL